jgi:HD superfamily phosphohydrolase
MVSAQKSIALSHVVPQVGFKEIIIYPPASQLYLILYKCNEIRRLNKLRQLGALTHALPGIRHSRWDYTIAILYYASLLNIPGANSSFKIGQIEFSSLKAALQCISLAWNIGHLPGTFAVEKGVYRYLSSRNPANPASALNWPKREDTEIQKIIKKAGEFLKQADYLGLARVLAVLKLIKFSTYENDLPIDTITTFYAPFLLEYSDFSSRQLFKLSSTFPAVRHCSYLTVDYYLSGVRWGPDIPSLFEFLATNPKHSFEQLSDTVSEILSPIERQMYENLYHNKSVRKEISLVSDRVMNLLKDSVDAPLLIEQWLDQALFRYLKLGSFNIRNKCSIASTIRLRSHFSGLPDTLVSIEKELYKKRFELPVAFEYQSWNSDFMFEPNEIIIDVMTMNSPRTTDVGKLLSWFISKFENFKAKPNDDFEVLRKLELESSYIGLMKRAIEIGFPNVKVRVRNWPLADFGIFKEYLESGQKGRIWASNARMDDPISKHIVRHRSINIPSRLKPAYTEMLGIIELRRKLIRKWINPIPRQKCLLVTSSIIFTRDDTDKDFIEYDGGIITVSSQGGRLVWYGLESKSGRTSPVHTLKRKIEVLGLKGNVFPLGKKHAYAELPIE